MLSIINDTINSSFLWGMGGSWLPWQLFKMDPVLSTFTLTSSAQCGGLCSQPLPGWAAARERGWVPGSCLLCAEELDGPGYLLSKAGETNACKQEAEVT